MEQKTGAELESKNVTVLISGVHMMNVLCEHSKCGVWTWCAVWE